MRLIHPCALRYRRGFQNPESLFSSHRKMTKTLDDQDKQDAIKIILTAFNVSTLTWRKAGHTHMTVIVASYRPPATGPPTMLRARCKD